MKLLPLDNLALRWQGGIKIDDSAFVPVLMFIYLCSSDIYVNNYICSECLHVSPFEDSRFGTDGWVI